MGSHSFRGLLKRGVEVTDQRTKLKRGRQGIVLCPIDAHASLMTFVFLNTNSYLRIVIYVPAVKYTSNNTSSKLASSFSGRSKLDKPYSLVIGLFRVYHSRSNTSY